jgi:hypothetical protein
MNILLQSFTLRLISADYKIPALLRPILGQHADQCHSRFVTLARQSLPQHLPCQRKGDRHETV